MDTMLRMPVDGYDHHIYLWNRQNRPKGTALRSRGTQARDEGDSDAENERNNQMGRRWGGEDGGESVDEIRI